MSSPQWKNTQPPIQDSAILALQRSDSFSGSNNSSSNSKGMRETGIIQKFMHSYGFIQCCDRQARLFFHYSQYEDDIDHLNIGDPVEFEMTYDRKTGKPVASAVVKISPSVLSCEVMSKERVSGVVTTEIKNDDDDKDNLGTNSNAQGRISYENRGECFFLPYTVEDVNGGDVLNAGDKCTFQIATDKRLGNLRARNIRVLPKPMQGTICALKENFGFIERADVVKEIFFHGSEAENFKDLKVGDNVEFTIQCRTGKDVATNIVKLPEGTVCFDDISEEVIKGQIIKPVDRVQARHQGDAPLPGRILYQSDSVDLEIVYGDKDQVGEFTLMPNDWVEFRIATDRRNKLERAAHIRILEESFIVPKEEREMGVVVAVKEGFGFIKCQNRETRMFFHFSELIDQSRKVQYNDEVEFTVIEDQSSPGRLNAVRIRYLPSGTVKFEAQTKELIFGIVERKPEFLFSRSPSKVKEENGRNRSSEAGIISCEEDGKKSTVLYYNTSCDPRNFPEIGDKVQFHVFRTKSNSTKLASDVKVVTKCEKSEAPFTNVGFVAALKDGFGFIEAEEHDREIFFHFSVYEGNALHLELGAEVEYCVSQKNSKVSAERVRKLPKGTIATEEVGTETLEGVVLRLVRCFNPDQEDYPGLIRVDNGEDEDAELYEFGITSLQDKREFLQKGDPVRFQIGVMKSTWKQRAVNVKALRKKLHSTVESIKGQFGFLSYEVEEGKKLFFHMSEVKDGITLQQGDKVEFVVVHNQRNGRYSACNVVKMTGSDPRPEHMITRFRTLSTADDGGPRLVVIRQPKGPDGTNGFKQSRDRRDSCPLPGI